ncbi:MAG: metal ABC transporter permease [Lautropia sp.]
MNDASAWTAFDWTILGPALVAGVLVLATHVPLGIQVLDRGIVFIDLAIAQIAGLGVIAAGALGFGDAGVVVQVSAIVAALAGAAALSWTERRAGAHQEALIGVAFVVAACVGILVLAHNPHGGEHLREMLVGQVLWVGTPQLVGAAAVTLVVLAALRFGWAARMGRFGFYAVFALAVTSSVQLVGVYLVFASLIVPALGSLSRAGDRRLPTAYAIGLIGYLAGLVASAMLDLPTGAVIVCTLVIAALSVAMVPASGSRRAR